MLPVDPDSLTGDDIVDAASSQIGSLGYKRYGYSNSTPAGVPKDNHFIADTLDTAGLGFGDNPSDRPSTADWADPSSTIPGWQPVTDGSIQPGDVLATPKPIARNWYEGGGQQLGVATGNGTSIGVVDNNRIGESGWGFQDGQSPTIWRSTQLADAGDSDAVGDSSSPSGNTLLTGSPLGDIWDSILGRKGQGSGGEDIPPREPGSDEDCDSLHDADICACNNVASPSARARCYASANQRYAACKTGRPMPPLDTGTW